MSKKNSPLYCGSIAIILAFLNSLILTLVPLSDQSESRAVKPMAAKGLKKGWTHRSDFIIAPDSERSTAGDTGGKAFAPAAESYSARIFLKISTDSSLINTTEGLLLLSYIQQFNPRDSQQLSFIFQVASDAQEELSKEQLAASENLNLKRSRLEELIDQEVATPYNHETLSEQWVQILQIYMGKIEERRNMNMRIAIQLEKIEGRSAQSGFSEPGESLLEPWSLADEKALVQADQLSMVVLDREIESLEADLSRALANLPMPVSSECTNLLKEYRQGSEAYSDQEIIVNKFENILAAAQYVDFSAI